MNIGTGQEITIANVVELIRKATGFAGEVRWQSNKPDGQPRRCLDVTLAFEKFGFRADTSLADGLKQTIGWYECNRKARRAQGEEQGANGEELRATSAKRQELGALRRS